MSGREVHLVIVAPTPEHIPNGCFKTVRDGALSFSFCHYVGFKKNEKVYIANKQISTLLTCSLN